MTTPDEKPGGNTVGRYFLLVVGCVFVAAVVAIAVSTRRDQIWRQARIEALHELEANSLGVDKPSPENFTPMQVVPRPPLVSGFEILDAEEADSHLDADETVLAVAINGEARAYPLNIMTGPAREVFNDTLGGKAIAATW